jgi:hypothetical protein
MVLSGVTLNESIPQGPLEKTLNLDVFEHLILRVVRLSAVPACYDIQDVSAWTMRNFKEVLADIVKHRIFSFPGAYIDSGYLAMMSPELDPEQQLHPETNVFFHYVDTFKRKLPTMPADLVQTIHMKRHIVRWFIAGNFAVPSRPDWFVAGVPPPSAVDHISEEDFIKLEPYLEEIYKDTGIQPDDALEVLKSFAQLAREEVRMNGTMLLPGLGTFKLRRDQPLSPRSEHVRWALHSQIKCWHQDMWRRAWNMTFEPTSLCTYEIRKPPSI